MEWTSVKFEGVLFEVYGSYDKPEHETGYNGGYLGNKYKVNGIEITHILSEAVKEQIDEQISSEI